MPAFKEDWKKAKTEFETATQKKKPSATFLGLFSKASGIGAALESADKAKTAGDLQKAMVAFKKAFDDYAKTLDKAVADPKVTPVADKPAYAAAVKKLKDSLDAIYTSAGDTMQSVVDAGAKSKDKVDPAALKKQAEAQKAVEAHTAQRRALAKMLTTTLSGYKSKGVEAAIENAVKQFQAAKTAKTGGNTMGADVAAQACSRFVDEANRLFAEINKDWTTRSQGGDMIRLRGDPSFADLAPDKQASAKKEAGEAWQETEKVQREVQAYLANLRTAIVKANSASEQADAFRIGSTTPETYLKRVAEIKARLEAMESGGTLLKNANKVDTVRERQKQLSEEPVRTPEDLAARKKMWGQLKTEHQQALGQAVQTLEELKETKKRLEGIPTDDKAVGTAVTAAQAVLDRVRTVAGTYATKGQAFVRELETYLAKT